MKKVKILLLAIGFVFTSNICSLADNQQENVEEVLQEKDNIYYDTIFTCSYPKEFKGKREAMLKLLLEIEGKSLKDCDAYLEVKKNVYKQTINSSRYAYFGKLKDGKPNGKGIIIDDNGQVYAGEFKNGECNGYGMYLNTSGITEEGEFKNGVLNGKGIKYYSVKYSDDSAIMDAYYETRGMYINEITLDYPVVTPSVSIEGTFSKGKADGKKIKSYYSKYNKNANKSNEMTDSNYGILCYEGEMSKEKYNGKGKLYYPSGAIKYEGEYKGDKYHGKGTLYNEDGTVKYKGKFKNGNVA